MKKTFAWLLCLLLVSLLAPMGALAAAGDVTVNVDVPIGDGAVVFDTSVINKINSYQEFCDLNAAVEWSDNVEGQGFGTTWIDNVPYMMWPRAGMNGAKIGDTCWCKITLNGRTLTVKFNVVAEGDVTVKDYTAHVSVFARNGRILDLLTNTAFFEQPEYMDLFASTSAAVEWSGNVTESFGFQESDGDLLCPTAYVASADMNASYWCKITLNGKTLIIYFDLVESDLIVNPLTGTPALQTGSYGVYSLTVQNGTPYILNCNDELSAKAKQAGWKLTYSWEYWYEVPGEDYWDFQEVGTERSLTRTATEADNGCMYSLKVSLMDGTYEREFYIHSVMVKVLPTGAGTATEPPTQPTTPPTPTVPKTGDSATPWLWTVVALAAMGCVVALSMRKHGKQNG